MNHFPSKNFAMLALAMLICLAALVLLKIANRHITPNHVIPIPIDTTLLPPDTPIDTCCKPEPYYPAPDTAVYHPKPKPGPDPYSPVYPNISVSYDSCLLYIAVAGRAYCIDQRYNLPFCTDTTRSTCILYLVRHDTLLMTERNLSR